MKNLLKSVTKINEETGEEVVKHSTIKIGKSPFGDEYYFVYYEAYVELVKKLKPRSAEVLLTFLIVNSNPINNRFNMSNSFRIEAMEYCGYTKTHIGRHLSSLEEAGLIVRIGKGEYMVNPYIAFKGKTNNRIKSIDLFKKVKGLI